MTNRKPFIVTPYSARDAGMTLRPEIPYACPFAVTSDVRDPCRIGMHHRRKRKTGPGYPLSVMSCEAHECTFTLYPPGFAPYQRQAVACLSPCGDRVLGEGRDVQTDFNSTMFEETLKAKTVGSRRRCRRSRKNARILGVGDLGDRLREAIATVLNVPAGILLSLSRCSDSLMDAVGQVLRQLRGTARFRASNLLVSGHLAGCWGEPLPYDADRKIFGRSPYCRSGFLERSTSQASRFRSSIPTKADRDHTRRMRCHAPPGC